MVFELPVPREALAAVCYTIPNVEDYINRAVALGLLEVSHNQALRVPRILPVQLPTDAEALYKQAAEVLYRLWWENPQITEEQKLEIHRLALRGKLENVLLEVSDSLVDSWLFHSSFRKAVQLCKSTLEVIKDYRILFQLAQSQTELGEVEQALKNYEQALDSCPSEDQEKKDDIKYHYATILHDRGDIKQAKEIYQQIKESTQDVQLKARILCQIAAICTCEGKSQEAIDKYTQSTKIYQDISDRSGKAATLHRIAEIYTQKGKLDEAKKLYLQSLEIQEYIGEIQGKATTLYELAEIFDSQGLILDADKFYTQSCELYKRALDFYKQIGHRQQEAATLVGIARFRTKFELEPVKDAIDYCQKALVIYQRLCNPQGEAETLYQLANIYSHQGQLEEAIEYYKQCLNIERRIGNVLGKAITMSILGELLLSNQENSTEALESILEALQEAQKILQEFGHKDTARLERLILDLRQNILGDEK